MVNRNGRSLAARYEKEKAQAHKPNRQSIALQGVAAVRGARS
jgi:hypothetical protein